MPGENVLWIDTVFLDPPARQAYESQLLVQVERAPQEHRHRGYRVGVLDGGTHSVPLAAAWRSVSV